MSDGRIHKLTASKPRLLVTKAVNDQALDVAIEQFEWMRDERGMSNIEILASIETDLPNHNPSDEFTIMRLVTYWLREIWIKKPTKRKSHDEQEGKKVRI